ncbi:hypothetical protein IWZ00DRAFT_513056 [Phyllosticta capitalensis]
MALQVSLFRLLPYRRLLLIFAPTRRPILPACLGLSGLVTSQDAPLLHPVAVWRFTGVFNRFWSHSLLGWWSLLSSFDAPLLRLQVAITPPSMVWLFAPCIPLLLWHLFRYGRTRRFSIDASNLRAMGFAQFRRSLSLRTTITIRAVVNSTVFSDSPLSSENDNDLD